MCGGDRKNIFSEQHDISRGDKTELIAAWTLCNESTTMAYQFSEDLGSTFMFIISTPTEGKFLSIWFHTVFGKPWSCIVYTKESCNTILNGGGFGLVYAAMLGKDLNNRTQSSEHRELFACSQREFNTVSPTVPLWSFYCMLKKLKLEKSLRGVTNSHTVVSFKNTFLKWKKNNCLLRSILIVILWKGRDASEETGIQILFFWPNCCLNSSAIIQEA